MVLAVLEDHTCHCNYGLQITDKCVKELSFLLTMFKSSMLFWFESGTCPKGW